MRRDEGQPTEVTIAAGTSGLRWADEPTSVFTGIFEKSAGLKGPSKLTHSGGEQVKQRRERSPPLPQSLTSLTPHISREELSLAWRQGLGQGFRGPFGVTSVHPQTLLSPASHLAVAV